MGLIGLGKMGFNMSLRLLDSKKINLHVYDVNPDSVSRLVEKGATGKNSVNELIEGLWAQKKVVWLMLPSGKITEETFLDVLSKLSEGDIIIDGGNSNFHDTLRRHILAKEKKVKMLDVGVSGGIHGAKHGYGLMIGGDEDVFEYCKIIFETLGIKNGYGRVGDGGAGHYVKMIHNAIEYGMMQSIVEGFDLLKNGSMNNLDLKKISHIWNHGTIISSFLMEMVEKSFVTHCTVKDCSLNDIRPYVEDNGEGRWSITEALENEVPFVVNTYALNSRYISRDKDKFSFKLLSAIRNEFGGHPIRKNE